MDFILKSWSFGDLKKMVLSKHRHVGRTLTLCTRILICIHVSQLRAQKPTKSALFLKGTDKGGFWALILKNLNLSGQRQHSRPLQVDRHPHMPMLLL